MNYSDPRVQKLVDDLELHLQELCTKFHDSTGHHLLIGFGMTDEVGTISAARASEGLRYADATKMCAEISHFVVGYYENLEDFLDDGDGGEPCDCEDPLIPS